MVALRLDRRLQSRFDPSDVIQEAYVDATAGLAEFVARGEMPFFLWLRWLTGMKLNAIHRKHLGFKVRDAVREISLNRGSCPQASTAALAAIFSAVKRAPVRSPSDLNARRAFKKPLMRWIPSTVTCWFCVTLRNCPTPRRP